MSVELGRRWLLKDRIRTEAARRRLAVSVASLGFFMIVLDTTVVNVALPSIERSLNGGVSGLQWVVDGYTLVFGALVLSAGHLSDRIGATVAFRRGLILFAASSAVCGLAPTMGFLLFARVLQGAAGAMLVPASMALVGQTHVEPRERANAIAIWAGAGSVAVAAGPLVGGLLTQVVGWRAVFFVNLPIAAAALLLLPLIPRSPRRAASFDLPGQALVILALGSLTFGVIEGAKVGFGEPQIVAALAVSVLATAMFAYVEHRSTDPAIPLGLLANRPALGTLAAALALFLTFYGLIFVLSLFFQQVLHHSPAASGLLFLPMASAMPLTTIRSGEWIHRFGAWRTMTAGLTLMSAGVLALVSINGASSWWQIGLCTIPVGVGAGMAGPAIPVSLLNALPSDRSGIASGIANALRQVAATFGVAIFGALLVAQPSFITGMRHCLAFSLVGLIVAVMLTVVWIRPRPATSTAVP
jgi:DHA2 family methylenomycin A resistance protein-like MFS transporter